MKKKLIVAVLFMLMIILSGSQIVFASESDVVFSSQAAEASYSANGDILQAVSVAEQVKSIVSDDVDNIIVAQRSYGCSTGCSSGCSSGCSMGCSSGCSVGCRTY